MSFFQKNKEILIAAGVIAGGTILYFGMKAIFGRGYLDKLEQQLKLTAGISEIGADAGFSNEEFQKALKELGWSAGMAWCVFYSKYIWSKILPKKKWDVAKNLLTGNSQTTWANFEKDKSGYFELSSKPKVGSIAIWQYPDATWKGHAGVVTSVDRNTFLAQEGNYAGKVSAGVKRQLVFDKVVETEGFKLLGFINVK